METISVPVTTKLLSADHSPIGPFQQLGIAKVQAMALKLGAAKGDNVEGEGMVL